MEVILNKKYRLIIKTAINVMVNEEKLYINIFASNWRINDSPTWGCKKFDEKNGSTIKINRIKINYNLNN